MKGTRVLRYIGNRQKPEKELFEPGLEFPMEPLALDETGSNRCFWCNVDAAEAAKHYEGPHLTWCPHYCIALSIRSALGIPAEILKP